MKKTKQLELPFTERGTNTSFYIWANNVERLDTIAKEMGVSKNKALNILIQKAHEQSIKKTRRGL